MQLAHSKAPEFIEDPVHDAIRDVVARVMREQGVLVTDVTIEWAEVSQLGAGGSAVPVNVSVRTTSVVR